MTESATLEARKVHIGCEACQALEHASKMPHGPEYLFFAGMGLGRVGQELALCEHHLHWMGGINDVINRQ